MCSAVRLIFIILAAQAAPQADKIIIRSPWGILCGPRAIVRGPRAVVRGPRAVVRGPRAVVRGPQDVMWSSGCHQPGSLLGLSCVVLGLLSTRALLGLSCAVLGLWCAVLGLSLAALLGLSSLK